MADGMFYIVFLAALLWCVIKFISAFYKSIFISFTSLLKSRILYFIIISFFISQWSSFFKDQTSTSKIYYQTGGDVEWWMRIISYKVQIAWMAIFSVYLGLRSKRLTWKQASQIGAYYWTAGKDIVDWFSNGNTGTREIDWIITLMLLIAVEIIWDAGVKGREKQEYRPTFRDYKRMQREIKSGNDFNERLSAQNIELQKQLLSKTTVNHE